jgi:hypothetical protein
MKKFLLIFPLILSVAIGGGAIYLIALFGHFPPSYRLAMAISLLISYVNMRNTNWDEAMKQSQDLSEIMKRWLMELLGTVVVMVTLGLCSLTFMWLK